MSTRGNPFEELERLFERMSRQFDEAPQPWESEGPLARWMPEAESMAIDLVERDEEFVATVDLPGFERDEISIEITDHTLRIEAERGEESKEESGDILRQERRHTTTKRSIRLPEEVQAEDVTARLSNGVLTVTLPKREAEAARSIDIE
ncbi:MULTISPECIES: Hsp20/alpha crystallin family protein [Haloarcula]|uniref:Hsp20/alpha crystallin family protein n=1 Tax=Haloarcula TaxID=2237 RepID=UPI0023EBFBD0|nr:Hsp20/alpha crystallin family protein [Halomicroarcula sp. XH51]